MCRKVLSLFNSLRETCIGAEFDQLQVFWKVCELLLVYTQQVTLSSRIGRRNLIFCRHFWLHHHGFQVIKRYRLHRTLRTLGNFPGQFFTHFRYCSADTELIDGNNCTDNFHFPLLFKSLFFKSAGSTEYRMASVAELSIIPSSIRLARVRPVPFLF